MYVLFNKPTAEKDLLVSALWYESKQKGLGERFLNEFEAVCSYIRGEPKLFPEKYPFVRQAPMKTFPFVVLYKVERRNIYILAVFNCKRDPSSKTLG